MECGQAVVTDVIGETARIKINQSISDGFVALGLDTIVFLVNVLLENLLEAEWPRPYPRNDNEYEK